MRQMLLWVGCGLQSKVDNPIAQGCEGFTITKTDTRSSSWANTPLSITMPVYPCGLRLAPPQSHGHLSHHHGLKESRML